MATTTKTRKRGSLFDTITQKEYPFQWEPKNEEDLSTGYGRQDIIGKYLPVAHYTGGSKNEVRLVIWLTGVAHNLSTPPSSQEIGKFRYNQGVAQNKAGQTVAPGSVDDAKVQIHEQKFQEVKKVLDDIKNIKALMQPQSDTGAPHPVYINLGSVYAGRRFVLEKCKVDYQTTNYDTMSPVEAQLSLSFFEIAGPGAES